MWELPRPQVTADQSLALCVSTVQGDRAQRLGRSVAYVRGQEASFLSHVTTGSYHLMEDHQLLPAGDATCDDLVAMYDQKLAKQNGPARSIYDRLVAAAPNGACPFCRDRAAKTLDHYLPKADFPALAVTPVNLVPCCRDCNFVKHEYRPTDVSSALLHPYFDTVADHQWLVATVVRKNPIGVRFDVSVSGHWSSQKADRLRNHFATYQLGPYYAMQAQNELSSLRHTLRHITDAGGDSAARKEFVEIRGVGYERDTPNSWQGALYRALAADSWFLSTGFR